MKKNKLSLDLPLAKKAWNKFQLSNDDKMKQISDERKTNKQKEVIEIEKSPDELVDIAVVNLDSNDKYVVYACLCMLTGRRQCEVLKTGVFTKSETPDKIYFYGQAKAKDYNPQKFEIYLLGISLERLNEWVTKLRNDFGIKDNMTLEDINQFHYTLNSRSNKLFDVNPHHLRDIYTEICWNKFENRTKLWISKFKQRLLGHYFEATTVWYNKIKLVDRNVVEEEEEEEDEITREMNKLIRELNEM